MQNFSIFLFEKDVMQMWLHHPYNILMFHFKGTAHGQSLLKVLHVLHTCFIIIIFFLQPDVFLELNMLFSYFISSIL